MTDTQAPERIWAFTGHKKTSGFWRLDKPPPGAVRYVLEKPDCPTCGGLVYVGDSCCPDCSPEAEWSAKEARIAAKDAVIARLVEALSLAEKRLIWSAGLIHNDTARDIAQRHVEEARTALAEAKTIPG